MRRGRNLVALASVAVVLGMALIGAATTSAPVVDGNEGLRGGAKIDALIERVVARQRSIRTLKADFVQHKTSSMLLDPVESSGEFTYLAPDRVRWDYRVPDSMVVLFADDTVTTYHPQRRLAERVKISRKHRRFVRALAGTQPLDELTSQFAVTLSDQGAPEPYRLTLNPTHRTLKQRLESVLLEVDRELMLPVTVQYNETDGDSTRYEFHRMVVNSQVEETAFLLELGEGVTVETIDASS